MSHMWSLITSTVLDSEGQIPGDDDDADDDFGDDVGDATVVRDGGSFEAVMVCPDTLSTSGKNDGAPHEAGGVSREVAAASGEQEALSKVANDSDIFEPSDYVWIL